MIEETEFVGAPSSVAEARAFTRHVLAAHGTPAAMVDAAALGVSELVTNAVVHATATSVPLRVSAGPPVRVEVEDGSRSPPRRRRGKPEEPGGLGLVVIEALASRWGTDVTAVGKVVWFELDPI